MDGYLDQVLDGYNQAARGYAASWTRPHPWMDDERARFAAALPKGADVVDVGCGPGHDTAHFASLGFRTIGIDVSDEMLRVARGNYPHLHFLRGDVVRGPLPTVPFDGVWAAYVLLHVPLLLQEATFQRMASLLRPNGVLFVATATAEGAEEVSKPIAGLTDAQGRDVAVPSTRMPVASLMEFASGIGVVVWSRLINPVPGRGGALHLLVRRCTVT